MVGLPSGGVHQRGFATSSSFDPIHSPICCACNRTQTKPGFQHFPEKPTYHNFTSRVSILSPTRPTLDSVQHARPPPSGRPLERGQTHSGEPIPGTDNKPITFLPLFELKYLPWLAVCSLYP